MTEEGQKQALNVLKTFGIEGLVVIGGDGSFKGAKDMSKFGVPVIGIPGTIDNDIACTEYTIGYDTALNTALDALDKIKDTAFSHERCSVLEVMGRHAGHLAVNVAIAGGAEVVLVPEKPFDINKNVIKPLIDARNRGKKHFVVIVAEGVGGAIDLARDIQERSGIESRATVLGHIQRGGSPTVRDRVAASMMGAKAVELLNAGIVNRVVAEKDNKVIDIDIEEALEMTKDLDEETYDLVRVLSM